jgi:hypothetical protein
MRTLTIGLCLAAFWIFFFEAISVWSALIARLLLWASIVVFVLYAFISLGMEALDSNDDEDSSD